MAIGFDVGSYTLICCTRDDKGNFQNNQEVNAFIEIKLDDPFTYNMMDRAGVGLVKRDNVAYALGEAAVKMAYTMSDLDLKRPMCEGCINPREKDAYEILNIMIHNLLEEVRHDKETLYYSVPANAINERTDADFHAKTLQAIFNAYESEKGYKVNAHPINEGLALVYAELANTNYTGMGVSFGAGMCNICFAIFGVPVFQFSLVNSGDWIDKMAAQATNESPTFINQEKMKINLSKAPTTLVERAIQTQYRIMVEKAVQGIKKGMTESGKKARAGQAIDIVVAGGTSLPQGFDELFKEIVSQAGLPASVGTIIKPADPLYSVARGALVAAEAAK